MENKREINDLIFNLQNNKTQIHNEIKENIDKTLNQNNTSKQVNHDLVFKIPTIARLNQSNPLYQSAQKSIKPLNSYSERYKHLLSTVDSKKSYCSYYNHFISNLFNEKKAQSVYQQSTNSFYLGKKTMRTTEDIMLESINKEKQKAKTIIKTNQQYYNSHKKYAPIPVSPSPLTFIKPFNLSSSSCSEYLKKRMSNTPNEITEINKKIKEKLTKKCKEYEDQTKNIKQSEVILSNEITLTPNIIKMKKVVDETDNMLSLSARINQYCAIASEILKKQTNNEHSKEDIENKNTNNYQLNINK